MRIIVLHETCSLFVAWRCEILDAFRRLELLLKNVHVVDGSLLVRVVTMSELSVSRCPF